MQLLAVACLSVAAKMEETIVPQSVDLQVGDQGIWDAIKLWVVTLNFSSDFLFLGMNLSIVLAKDVGFFGVGRTQVRFWS